MLMSTTPKIDFPNGPPSRGRNRLNYSFQEAILLTTQHNKIRQAALQYARLGLRVIPLCSYDHKGMSERHRQSCPNPGKVPLLGNWTNKASDVPGTVDQWFDKYRTANVGVLTGVAGGIVAIDVDGDYGHKRLVEISSGEIPATWEFTTPGGGHRYLFLAPEYTPLRKYSDALPGTDHQEIAFLGDHHQTVMPPSQHKNGGTYEWVEGRSPDDIEIAPAPDWMILKMSLAAAAIGLFDEDDTNPSPYDRPDQPEKHHLDSGQKPINLRPESISSKPRADSISSTLKTNSESEKARILRDKCSKVAEAWKLQSGVGCDWHTWFRTASLLVKAGALDDALAFSELSRKHNEYSRSEIEGMTRKAFGPTRCTTLGCDAEQIKKCFGKFKKNDNNEITNSPVAFLKAEKSAYSNDIAELVEKFTSYRVRFGAIGEVGTNKEGEETFKPFANFVPVPLEDVCLDDGATQERCFVISGRLLDDDSELPPRRVSHLDFHEPTKWVIHWGLRPTIFPGNQNKERVRHTVQLLSHGVKNSVVYTHLGYRKIGGEWRYLHAGGCSDDDSVKVEADSRLRRYVLPSKEKDPIVAIQRCFSLLGIASERVTLPLLATMFLAPLCEILRKIGLEPAFVVWLFGQTGARKSTIAALFMCLFGNFSAKSPPASYKDTALSLERRGFACKDSVLWIDDFHPTQNPLDARKMEQTAQSHIRSYGDRVGRGRLDPNAKLKADYPPKGLALDTGEQLPDGHSSNARLLGIELLPEDVNLDKLTEAQRLAPQLAEAMLGYTRWLGNRMSDVDFDRHLEERFFALRSEAESSRSHGRIAETVAWLRLGLECLLDYAVSVGAVTPEEKEVRLMDGWRILLSLADGQNDTVRESMPVTQFLDTVSELLQNGTIHVQVLDSRFESEEDSLRRTGKHVGWRDEHFYYFLPKVLYNEVSSFLANQHEHIPLKMSALWKQLDVEGALTTETYLENGAEKVKRVRRKTIGGVRVPALWVKKECVSEPDESEARRRDVRSRAAIRQTEAGDLFDQG
ncbi:bifunctional DNA primase/polymerase [Paenibacillus sp. GYB004]|uniref:bifunctional DNA primase/polymerase n=1 Tax=Paenibacillus sp. GYB004 TaxID=2994393 RepID=UPI002F96B284